MSLYSKRSKDINFRFFFNFFEKKKILLKSLMFNAFFEKKKIVFYYCIFSSIANKSSISFIKNRCYFTYRSRGIVSKYKLSRHLFKKFVTKGYLCNFKKI